VTVISFAQQYLENYNTKISSLADGIFFFERGEHCPVTTQPARRHCISYADTRTTGRTCRRTERDPATAARCLDVLFDNRLSSTDIECYWWYRTNRARVEHDGSNFDIPKKKKQNDFWLIYLPNTIAVVAVVMVVVVMMG